MSLTIAALPDTMEPGAADVLTLRDSESRSLKGRRDRMTPMGLQDWFEIVPSWMPAVGWPVKEECN